MAESNVELFGGWGVQDDRTAQLVALMTKYDLDDADVGQLVGVTVTTVSIWRCKNPARIIPANTLRLLEAELLIRAGKVAA